MKRIAILGPGLLGGSIAMKLRRLGGFHVTMWGRRELAIKQVEAAGCADIATRDLDEAVKDADLIVLCVPVGAMGKLARRVARSIRPGTIVTDVGSVKTGVMKELGRIFRGTGRFVGSHPMAGSEKTGLKAARTDLFDHTTCIVTRGCETDHTARPKVRAFWKRLGCRVVEMTASEHDDCVALVSHLPHLLAAALVNTVEAANPHGFNIVGPGFRDTSRVASGPPEMWTEILTENSGALIHEIDALIAKLRDFRNMLQVPGDKPKIRKFLAAAKKVRDRIKFPIFKNNG